MQDINLTWAHIQLHKQFKPHCPRYVVAGHRGMNLDMRYLDTFVHFETSGDRVHGVVAW